MNSASVAWLKVSMPRPVSAQARTKAYGHQGGGGMAKPGRSAGPSVLLVVSRWITRPAWSSVAKGGAGRAGSSGTPESAIVLG